MKKKWKLPPNTTGIPDVYTVDDFADRIIEAYHTGKFPEEMSPEDRPHIPPYREPRPAARQPTARRGLASGREKRKAP